MIVPTDISRWETAIQQVYEKRLLYYPNAALGWRLLYSPRRVLSGARVAFLGLNPGGRSLRPEHGEFSSEAGSAYRREVEDWGTSSPLQDQVMALFQRLNVSPEDVLAGNLVPFRSPSEDTLAGAMDAIAFGRNLWKDIFNKVRPSVVVTMGGTANREVSALLGVKNIRSYPTGWGNYTATRGQFTGGTWVGLPHLSRFGIMTRSASGEALDQLFTGLS